MGGVGASLLRGVAAFSSALANRKEQMNVSNKSTDFCIIFKCLVAVVIEIM